MGNTIELFDTAQQSATVPILDNLPGESPVTPAGGTTRLQVYVVLAQSTVIRVVVKKGGKTKKWDLRESAALNPRDLYGPFEVPTIAGATYDFDLLDDSKVLLLVVREE